jgi:hypothetical protein
VVAAAGAFVAGTPRDDPLVLPGAVILIAATVAVWDLVAGAGAALGYANASAATSAAGGLLVAGWAIERRDRLSLVVVPLLCVFAAHMFYTESRAAWLACAGGACTALALRCRRPGTWAALVLVSSLVVTMVAAVHSSSPRHAYWEASLHGWLRDPAGGTGAGTWERVWLLDRDAALTAHNAHSLYLEVLTEIGPVGLLLLVTALALPLVAAVRARHRRYVLPVVAAYASLLVHFGVDWEWSLTAVQLLGVALAASLLVRGSPRASLLLPRPWAAAFCALALAGGYVWLEGAHLARAQAALREGRVSEAVDESRAAARYAPWAADPWRVRGLAELEQGRPAAATASLRRGLEKDGDDPELWRLLAGIARGPELRHARLRVTELDPLASP